MGIPPTPPSSTPASSGSDKEEGPSEKKRLKRDFKLPGKKEGDEHEKKKKGLFELAGGEVREIKPEVQQKQMEVKTEQTEAVTQKGQANQISRLILRMVTEMQIGVSRDYARLSLAHTDAVPESFAGSNLTLNYVENGLTIRFSDFTPQNQMAAVSLVENNRDELTKMLQALQARNIRVTELTIGSHTVSLPRIEPLPPPFQAPSPQMPEREQRRQEQEGRGGGEE